MPIYAFKGFDAAGKAVSGTRESDNPRNIKQLLRRDGVFLTELSETGPKKVRTTGETPARRLWNRAARVNTQDLAVATRQLSTLVGSGIPLVDALTALVAQIDNPAFKGILSATKQRVNEGASLADALGEHPRTFTSLYVNMVRAGESSGALDVVLDRLADFTENQAELRSKLKGTMVYPALMVTMAFGVVAMLFIFVVPKIARIFASQQMALPLPTQVLIAVSSFTADYWAVLILLAIALVFAARRYVGTKSGRRRWDVALLRLPLFGSLLRMIAITRFCKTLATLLGAGVPLLKAFDIVRNVVENRVLMDVVETVRDCVKEGESIAAPLQRSGEFPPIVTHMIDIGEKSGQLESMLANVARSYDVQIDARIRGMTSVIEPLIIVVMGVVVAGIVFAVLLPMLQMSSGV